MRRAVDFVICYIKAMGEDELSLRAAALAYYAVFSIFPLMLLITSAVGFFLADASRQEPVLRTIREFTSLLPGWAQFAKTTLEGVIQARGGIGILAVLGLLWAASGFFRALEVAVNIIFGTQMRRSLWKSRGVGMLMAVLTLPLFLLATFLTLIGSTLAHIRFLPDFLSEIIARTANPLASLTVVVLAFLLLYEFIPRKRPPLRPALAGALVAGLSWGLLTLGFNRFLESGIVDYNVVYGSIGAVIALILWLYLTSLIILLGAELAAQLAHVKECDSGRFPPLAEKLWNRSR